MKITKLLSVLLIICMVLTGCKSKKVTVDYLQSGTDSPKSITKVSVGTEGTYSPFTYKDENGKLTGYDIEVVQEIDKRLDDVEFEFIPTQWDSMFLGLESNKYDMIADQISKSAEREEKFSFSNNSYFLSAAQIIVKKDNNKTINTLDDLNGMKFGVSVGTSFAKILEDYNKEHNNALTIKYYEGNITNVLQDIEAGRIDATVNDRIIATDSIKKLGLKIKLVGNPVEVTPAYFVFRKGSEGDALKNKVDKVIEEIIADGTLSKLSIKWFEEDYTK